MSDNLTIEVLNNLMRTFPITRPSIELIEVPETPIYGPARRHRKRRIQKKWLKRYGQKIIGYERHLGDQIYVHEKSGAAFCHPDIAARLRYDARRMEAEMRQKINNEIESGPYPGLSWREV